MISHKVKGFPVYGTAQPTEEGFKNVLEKIPKTLNEDKVKKDENKDDKVIDDESKVKDEEKEVKDEKDKAESDEGQFNVIWYNMRQEPVIYINGMSFAPRHPER